MIVCILFALALFLAKNNNTSILGISEDPTNPLPPMSISRYPRRFRDDWEEKSAVGRPQFELRNPFGPSPDQKYIQDQSFFDNEYYQNRYQKDQYLMHTKTQDWRFEPTLFGVLNNYCTSHQPEDNLGYIKEFADTDTSVLNQNEDLNC